MDTNRENKRKESAALKTEERSGASVRSSQHTSRDILLILVIDVCVMWKTNKQKGDLNLPHVNAGDFIEQQQTHEDSNLPSIPFVLL